MWTVIIFSNKDCSFFDLSLDRRGHNFSPTLLLGSCSQQCLFYYDKVSARDSHIKHESEAVWLIWVEGWYQGRYGKFHVIIYFSHISH